MNNYNQNGSVLLLLLLFFYCSLLLKLHRVSIVLFCLSAY